jgi:hypothetical protein
LSLISPGHCPAPGRISTSVTLSSWSLKLQYSYWGNTYCPNLKSKFYFLPREYFCFPLIEEQVDPTVWTDSTTVSQAKTGLPVQIKLKAPL